MRAWWLVVVGCQPGASPDIDVPAARWDVVDTDAKSPPDSDGETSVPAPTDTDTDTDTPLDTDAVPPPAGLPCDLLADAQVTVSTPSDLVTLRGAWAPIVARVPPRAASAELQVCLDGQPVPQAWPVTRRRPSKHGGDWDVVAGLQLLDRVAPGPHGLRVILRFADGQVSEGFSSFLYAPRPNRVDVTLHDADGAPLSARVLVTRDGLPVTLGPEDGLEADPEGRDVPRSAFYVLDGVGSVLLDDGAYTLTAVRSIRDELATRALELVGDATVDLTMVESVPLPTHLSSDLHVHTAMSYDAWVPHDRRFASLAGAGIEVAVVTDHNVVTEGASYVDALLGPSHGGLHVLSGIEADVREPGPLSGSRWDWGHLNVLPVVPGAVERFPGLQPDDLPTYYDDFRMRQLRAPHPDAGADVLLQLNHPRGIHFRPEADPNLGAWPLFRELGFDPDVPIGEGLNGWMTETSSASPTTALDLDAMEIVNRFSLVLYEMVRRDWFAMLDQGYRITGTGNADSHAEQVELVGFPVTLVEAPRPTGQEDLDVPAWMAGVRGGRAIVTTGPIPELTVVGDGVSGTAGDTVVGTTGVVAQLRVRAASWVPVPEVRLIVNGAVEQAWPVDFQPGADGLLWTAEVPLTLSDDSWVLLEAGVPLDGATVQPILGGAYGLVAPGYVPISFTNPVYVDVDGDGGWMPPGLFP